MRVTSLLPLAVLCVVIGACESEGTFAASGTTGPNAADVGADSAGAGSGDVRDTGGVPDAVNEDATPDVEPTLPDLPEGWTIIEPGGDTICSRGTPFRYAVRRGSVNRVLVEFMGGGACWDDTTCSFAGAIFNEDTEFLVDIVDQVGGTGRGIYDDTDPRNPFGDWYHVFIPYCTGDLHWGDAVATYGSGGAAVTIEHRGAVNVRAVMDWLTAGFSAPEQVFVTGCSAGAYGSAGWTPRIIEAFPDARVAQMGDCGVGIITERFFEDSFPSWNAEPLLPDWIPGLDPDEIDIYELNLSDLYGRVANHYADYVFSQYTTAFDENQTFYFEAMGGSGQDEWSDRMYEMIAQAVGLAPNFASYIAPGERHCILPFDELYTVEADGVLLIDWIDALVAGENPGHVRCTNCAP